MAYAQLYNCKNVMLLYPHHADLPRDPICQRFSTARRDGEETLFVATLNLGGAQRDHKIDLKALVDDCLDREAASQSNCTNSTQR